MQDIIENFHQDRVIDAEIEFVPAPPAPEPVKLICVSRFQPATDRLLLLRLPPPPEGLIVKPQIAQEQSEYGEVIAIGKDVDVPVGVVAKFSRFSAEDIVFEDAENGDEYVLAYKHDIRGWLKGDEPSRDRLTGEAELYARS